MNIHVKVKWAAVAAVLATAVQGALEAGDITLPAYLASAVTGLLAIVAGYAAPGVNEYPAHGSQDPAVSK